MTKISLYKIDKPTKSNPKRKVWMLRWVGTDGKRYGETIGSPPRMTKREAEAIRRDRVGKIDNGLVPVNRPKAITLTELAKHDRALIADSAYKTLLAHDNAVQRATKVWGDLRAADVGAAHVATLKARMRQKPYADATIDQTVRVLRAMWNRAKREGLLLDNPFSGAGVRCDPADSRIFEPNELDAMVAVSTDWWQSFLRLGFGTGLRKEELLHLRWHDVDLDGGHVKVCRHDAGRFTVDGSSYPLLPWKAKAKASYRTVPLPTATVDVLRRFKLKAGRSAYVFMDLGRLARLDAKMTAGTLRRNYEPVNNLLRDFKLEIQPKARAMLADQRGVQLDDVDWEVGCIHDLRDTYGATMSWHVPANVLMRLMGHSDIKTTMNYYAHATASEDSLVRSAVAASGLGGQTDTQLTPDPNKDHSSTVEMATNRASRYDAATLSA